MAVYQCTRQRLEPQAIAIDVLDASAIKTVTYTRGQPGVINANLALHPSSVSPNVRVTLWQRVQHAVAAASQRIKRQRPLPEEREQRKFCGAFPG